MSSPTLNRVEGKALIGNDTRGRERQITSRIIINRGAGTTTTNDLGLIRIRKPQLPHFFGLSQTQTKLSFGPTLDSFINQTSVYSIFLARKDHRFLPVVSWRVTNWQSHSRKGSAGHAINHELNVNMMTLKGNEIHVREGWSKLQSQDLGIRRAQGKGNHSTNVSENSLQHWFRQLSGILVS